MNTLQTDTTTLNKSLSLETIWSHIGRLQTEITTVQSSCQETLEMQISSLKTDMKMLRSLEDMYTQISSLETDMASVRASISGIVTYCCNLPHCSDLYYNTGGALKLRTRRVVLPVADYIFK